MGRKRWLQDINPPTSPCVALAERNAINSPIQGTAADKAGHGKIGAVRAAPLQIKDGAAGHDELCLIRRVRSEAIKPVILDCINSDIANLISPILAEVGVGANWLEAH